MTCDNVAKYATIQGGIEIGKENRNTSGILVDYSWATLGCIVHRRNYAGRDNVYLLSAQHEMHAYGRGAGDYIYHPAPKPGSNAQKLGPVMEGGMFGDVPFGSPPQPVFIDCAIARLDDTDSTCCGTTCTEDMPAYAGSIIDLKVTPPGAPTESEKISDVRSVINDPSWLSSDFPGETVTKVGRTTGKTEGTAKLLHRYGHGDPNNPIWYHNVIAIRSNVTNCKGNKWFAEVGDSGALVLDAQNRAIGLLVSGPHPGSPPGAASFACHIVPVLDHLNICIPCTPGTLHGSSLATDGSGFQPSALSPSQSTLPTGRIVFTSEQAEAAPPHSPTLTTPVPVTDDEVRHMRALLAAFRTTRMGPELHGVFAEVRREIGYLVRNSRPVKVAWHRHEGPAFFAHVLNHLAGHTDRVPHEVQGITRRALLVRMREVLSAHGSNQLRHALERYGDDLLTMLTSPDCNSVEDCIAWLQERELA